MEFHSRANIARELGNPGSHSGSYSSAARTLSPKLPLPDLLESAAYVKIQEPNLAGSRLNQAMDPGEQLNNKAQIYLLLTNAKS